jgi:hypothetical protein
VATLRPCRGRVVDAAGKPVRGALVAELSGVPEIALVTDEEGRFAVNLPAGRYRFRATAPGGETAEAEWDGNAGVELELRLSARLE